MHACMHARTHTRTHAHIPSHHHCTPAVLLDLSSSVLVDSFSSVTVDFAVLFVMPVMGRMSDQDTSVRLAASMCFAQLIPLAALQVSCPHLRRCATVGGARQSAGPVPGHVAHLACCGTVFDTGYCVV